MFPTLQLVLTCLFAVSLGLVATTYVIYPAVLWVLYRLSRSRQTVEQTPLVTLFISAFNEEAVIEEKIENALALDYPREHLEIVVISDESTDRTDEIVAAYADKGVVLRRQEPRRGKSAGLTRFVPEATGELLVFSDANSIYRPDAIRRLVQHFHDENVGFVAGHQRYYDDDNAAATSESLYWRYETAIKVLQSRVCSITCGDGAIYATRASLFEPLATDDINDFSLPLRIIIRGYQGVFESDAVCYEHAASDFGGEFRRRVRIVNRSFRAVCRNWRASSPVHTGWFSIHLLTHKVLRWFVPFLLAITLFSNTALVAIGSHPVFAWILGLQLICYLLAASHVVPAFQRFRPVYICYYFCLANSAAGLGILTYFFGRRIEMWTPERGQHERQPVTASMSKTNAVPAASKPLP